MSFTKLVAWQKSHKLALMVLAACETMPKYDTVRSQLERAVVSVTSNIAEGFGRQTINDKKHFYVIARGSAFEVQNQLLIAEGTGKISNKQFQILAAQSLDSIRLIHGLIRSLERRRHATS